MYSVEVDGQKPEAVGRFLIVGHLRVQEGERLLSVEFHDFEQLSGKKLVLTSSRNSRPEYFIASDNEGLLREALDASMASFNISTRARVLYTDEMHRFLLRTSGSTAPVYTKAQLERELNL